MTSPRFVFIAALLTLLPNGTHAQVELRPVDRATVRLIAFTGVASARDGDGSLRLGMRAAHGTGVYIGRDGWIATAGHVVDHADYLVALHPGEDRGHPAEVVYISGEHDLALVRVRGRAPHHLPLERGGSLSLGQPVSVSGYPLDPRERWPAAASGQVGRPLNDGRIQLAISVNPGNSGGPVITRNGTLVGIISQGANPAAGAQGIAIMEPIRPLVARMRTLRRGEQTSLAEQSPEANMLLEHLEARPQLTTDARVARLSTLNSSSHVSAAIFAVEAMDLLVELLRDAGVTSEADLLSDQRVRYQQVHEIALRWAAQGVRESDDDYAVLAEVGRDRAGTRPRVGSPSASAGTSTSPAAARAPAVTGPATGPSEWAPAVVVEEEMPPIVSFSVEAHTGFLLDDAPNAETLGGGVIGVAAGFRLFVGHSPYFRSALTLGASFEGGAWRDASTLAVLADLGYRFEFGPQEFAIILTGAYTPGWVNASARETLTAIGYRVGIGVQVDFVEVALSWREVSRDAGTPLRALLLTTTLELTP